jgi:hypothetical protein
MRAVGSWCGSTTARCSAPRRGLKGRFGKKEITWFTLAIPKLSNPKMEDSVALRYVRGELCAREYWDATKAEFDFDEICCGEARWSAHLFKVVDEAFWRLDSLDRSDPFWRGTNKLATRSKLHDFAVYESRKGANAATLAWLMIALELSHGGHHLQPAPWEALAEAGELDYRFLLCSSFATSAWWTELNLPQTANLLRLLPDSPTAALDFEWLRAKGSCQSEWVDALTEFISFSEKR